MISHLADLGAIAHNFLQFINCIFHYKMKCGSTCKPTLMTKVVLLAPWLKSGKSLPVTLYLDFSWITSYSHWKGSSTLTVLPIHATLLPQSMETVSSKPEPPCRCFDGECSSVVLASMTQKYPLRHNSLHSIYN